MRKFINIIESLIKESEPTDLNAYRKKRERDDIVQKLEDAMKNIQAFKEQRRLRSLKYHKKGLLPLPIGTVMLPPKASGYSTKKHVIVGYYMDDYKPDIEDQTYGYYLGSDMDDKHPSILWVRNPKLGVYEKQAAKVQGWIAVLGPNGAEKMQARYIAPNNKPIAQHQPEEPNPEFDHFWQHINGIDPPDADKS